MKTNYGIFFTGPASTPITIGLINWANNETIHEISCDKPTGKGTRAAYDKYRAILENKYSVILQKSGRP